MKAEKPASWEEVQSSRFAHVNFSTCHVPDEQLANKERFTAYVTLDTAQIRMPNVFMELHLKPDGQPIGQNPLRKLARVQFAEDRGKL